MHPGARCQLEGLFSAPCHRSRAITAPLSLVGSGISRGQHEGCSANGAALANSNQLLRTVEPGPCLQLHLELETATYPVNASCERILQMHREL